MVPRRNGLTTLLRVQIVLDCRPNLSVAREERGVDVT